MRGLRRTAWRVCTVAASVSLFACVTTEAADGSNPAAGNPPAWARGGSTGPEVGGGTADTGTSGDDSGVPLTDGAGPPPDSGSPPTDSGTPPTDSGTPPTDSGPPPFDSGTKPTDSGTPPTDSGTPPTDSDTTATDAGPPPTDSDTAPADSGSSFTDSGSASDSTTEPPDSGTVPPDATTEPPDATIEPPDTGNTTPATDSGDTLPTLDSGATSNTTDAANIDDGAPSADAPIINGNASKCSAANECASGFCVDGVCCNSACTTKCWSCALPTAPGICSPQPPGYDLRSECGADNSCTKTCGKTGDCVAAKAGDECSRAKCTTASEGVGPAVCSNSKTCDQTTAVPFDCHAYACNAAVAACYDQCNSSDQCAIGFVCDGTGHCLPGGTAVNSGGCNCETTPGGAAGGDGTLAVVVGLGIAGALSQRRRRPR